MNVSCPDCGSVFRVDPAKVAPQGVRAKCSICGGVVSISSPRPSAGVIVMPTPIVPAPVVEAPVEPVARETPTPVSSAVIGLPDFDNSVPDEDSGFAEIPLEAPASPPAHEEFVEFPPVPEPVDATPRTPLTPVRPLTPVSEAPIVAPPIVDVFDVETPTDEVRSAEPVASEPRAVEPEVDEPADSTAESSAPAAAPPAMAPPPVAPPARPAIYPPVRSPTPRTTMPTAVPPATPASSPFAGGFRPGPAGIAGVPRPVPSAAPPAPPTPAAPVIPPVPPSPLTPTNIASIPTPMVSPAVTTPLHTPILGGDAVPRRPLNPFLANDPSAKAKRLARALVSDMIAYLPQKREEGLRDGTLKQIFREEIKKSYEEYVDQIGREIAENTTHFQEALNDLLAGGQKIF